MPKCAHAQAVGIGVHKCNRRKYDPLLPADCSGCRDHEHINPVEETTMRQKTQATPDVADRLADMGFKRAPSSLFARTCRRGKYLIVSCSRDRPQRLTISRELVAEAGIEKGAAVDVYCQGKRLAIAIGSGPLRLSTNGKALAISCPRLLEKLGVTKGQRFPADVTDGVLFVDLGGEKAE